MYNIFSCFIILNQFEVGTFYLNLSNFLNLTTSQLDIVSPLREIPF